MTMEPDHSAWTHEQEMAWYAQVHAQELAKMEASRDLELQRETYRHEVDMTLASGDQLRRRRRQWVRFFITVFTVCVWLAQTGYITYHAIWQAGVLMDIEKYVLLIGVTGGVVYLLIPKLWPDAETDEPPTTGAR